MTPRFRPIGTIHSCFEEKFGIPRQPGLAPAVAVTLDLDPRPTCLESNPALGGVDSAPPNTTPLGPPTPPSA